MKKIFLILLLLLPTVYADNISLLQANPAFEQIKTDQNQTFTIQLFSDVNATGEIALWQGSYLISTNPFSIDENTYNYPTINYSSSQYGLKNLSFKLQNLSISDANAEDNQIDTNQYVCKGLDLKVISITIVPPNPLPNEVGHIIAVIKNIGDYNESQAFPFYLSDEANQIYSTDINGLVALETKTIEFDYNIPSYLGTKHIFATVNSPITVEETDTTNNTTNYILTNSAEADLTIYSSELGFIETPRQNMLTNFKALIRNIGGKIAVNFSAKFYMTSVSDSHLIYETQISSLPSSSAQEILIPYTPRVLGINKIIVVVDKENTVLEESEANNSAELEFTISEFDLNETIVGYTVFSYVVEKCFVVLSNNDILSINKIVDNNAGQHLVEFSLIDESGTTIIAGTEGTDFEEQAIGVTLRIMNVSSTDATIMLIYPYPVSKRQSTCVIDLTSCLEEKAHYMRDSQAKGDSWLICLNNLDVATANYSYCVFDLNTAKVERSTCASNLATCQFNVNNADTKCYGEKQILMENDEAQSANDLYQEKLRCDVQIETSDMQTQQFYNMFWIENLVLFLLLAGFAVFKVKEWKDKKEGWF